LTSKISSRPKPADIFTLRAAAVQKEVLRGSDPSFQKWKKKNAGEKKRRGEPARHGFLLLLIPYTALLQCASASEYELVHHARPAWTGRGAERVFSLTDDFMAKPGDLTLFSEVNV
jgi:hypothetical protein